jgi:hypothetical protein
LDNKGGLSFRTTTQGIILGVSEPVGSVCLQCRELSDQRREVAGYVPGYVLTATPVSIDPYVSL